MISALPPGRRVAEAKKRAAPNEPGTLLNVPVVSSNNSANGPPPATRTLPLGSNATAAGILNRVGIHRSRSSECFCSWIVNLRTRIFAMPVAVVRATDDEYFSASKENRRVFVTAHSHLAGGTEFTRGGIEKLRGAINILRRIMAGAAATIKTRPSLRAVAVCAARASAMLPV